MGRSSGNYFYVYGYGCAPYSTNAIKSINSISNPKIRSRLVGNSSPMFRFSISADKTLIFFEPSENEIVWNTAVEDLEQWILWAAKSLGATYARFEYRDEEHESDSDSDDSDSDDSDSEEDVQKGYLELDQHDKFKVISKDSLELFTNFNSNTVAPSNASYTVEDLTIPEQKDDGKILPRNHLNSITNCWDEDEFITVQPKSKRSLLDDDSDKKTKKKTQDKAEDKAEEKLVPICDLCKEVIEECEIEKCEYTDCSNQTICETCWEEHGVMCHHEKYDSYYCSETCRALSDCCNKN